MAKCLAAEHCAIPEKAAQRGGGGGGGCFDTSFFPTEKNVAKIKIITIIG